MEQESESSSQPEDPTDPAGKNSPDQNDQPPPFSKKCGSCLQPLTKPYAFCPNCGQPVQAKPNTSDLLKKHEASLARDDSLKDLHRVIRLYLTLLLLNILAAYVLPVEAAWGMLFADTVIISITTYWISKEFVLVRPYLVTRLNLVILVLAGLGSGVTFGVAYLNSHLAITLLGLRELMETTEGTTEFFDAQIPLAILIFSIAVIPGVFEEIFFRGLIQGHLEKHVTKNEALVVQAVIFAIAHIDLIGFFTYLLFMGLYFGWLRNRTRSLIPGIIAHFAHNTLVILQLHYWPEF